MVLEIVQNHLKKVLEGVTTPKLLLACSGGVDSMVLLHLLEQAAYPFGVAHCNFGLRAEESDADAAFIALYCKSKEITYFETTFETKNYAHSKGISTQMAARTLRYQWFNQLKVEEGFTHLLTAHHLDDQMETFLINVGRASGIKGLTGIPGDSILRPLLQMTKAEILAYAEKHHIPWREDASNAADDYLRNQLRHHILPQWKAIDPGITQQFEKTRQQLAWAQEALSHHCNTFQATHFIKKDNRIEISLTALQSLHPLEYYLHALFSPYGFSNFLDLNALLTAQSGKQLVSNTHRLIKDRTQLFLVEKDGEQSPKRIEWTPTENLDYPLNLRINPKESLAQNTARLDQSALKYPLILRKYQEGDYFYPVGMKGKKKLSKFFKDEKYSLLEKEQQWLLCTEEAIVWVIGQRVDARFAAVSSTVNPLIIACN
ncbi:MAG: tRNA lysidine(34) synthetase TilS [Flavobacteriaceae bacterium]